jgi:hypothetical protein
MSKNQAARPPKRIAWSYLLPVGTYGSLNVGVREEFYYDETNQKNERKTVSRSQPSRGGVGEDNNHEEEDKDDDEREFPSVN